MLHKDFQAKPLWWEDFAPGDRERAAGDPGGVPEKFDVAIVGGGYAGLATALELAKLGARSVVLDAEAIGWGASSRNAGFVSTHSHLESRYGLKSAPAAEELRQRNSDAREAMVLVETLIREEAIACHWTPSGHYTAAATPAHFAKLVAKAEKLNGLGDWNAHIVGRADQRSEVGSDYHHGGMVTGRSATIQPALYAKGLIEACRRRGVALAGAAPVSALERSGSSWLVRSARGTVVAGQVVIATNGYTGALTPELQRRVVPIGSTIIATEEIGDGLARELVPNNRSAYDTRRVLNYWRLSHDRRRFLFGGRVRFRALSPTEAAPLLHAAMVTRFPQLRDIRITHAWTGNLGFTFDERGHAGEMSGLHYALGCNGTGVGLMTFLGTRIARRIAGTSNYLSTWERPDFPTHPLYRGNPWFLPLIGGYYRLRDWIELRASQ